MTAPFNPQMLTLARESRGLSQAEVAASLGVSKTLINRIEHNDYSPTAALLQQFSHLTNYPVTFFYQQGEPVSGHLAYRKRATVAPRILSSINANMNILRLQLNTITTGIKLKPPQLPVIPVTEAVSPAMAAMKLRRLWKLDDAPVDNLCTLLEQQGVIVTAMNFGSERVDSRTFFTTNGIPVICYNSTLKGDKQRFSLAFELAHLVMHTNTHLPAERDINHEANVFAASLLMPHAGIMADMTQDITLTTLATLKPKWKVSMIALLYRADDLGLITANQKRYLIDQFNKLGIRRNEPPDLDILPEQPQLLHTYIAQYKKKANLQNRQLAERLGLYTKELVQQFQL